MGRYGVVRTFVVSVLLFTVASFLCGIAWSLPSLIFFRVLQGGVSGPDDPRHPGAADLDLPVRQARRGAGHLVDHHLGGADLRPHPGRLYLRQLSLGLDFPDQRAGGPGRDLPVLAQPEEPRDADPQAADRHGRPGAAGGLGRRAAGDAGHGQGRGLVRLHPDRDPGDRHRHRLRRLADLGADRRRIRSSTCRCSRTATSRWAPWPSAWAMPCSSPTTC